MAKTDKSVNLAVIGAGYWGQKVIREYIQLSKLDPDFQLVKVCDLKQDNLKYCKENMRLSSEKLTTDLDEVLDSREVNAVHICTPNDTHFPFGKHALEMGKNVLMEKPMALTAKSAWDMCSIAQSKHLTLQVGHIYRFNNAIKTARELMNQNYLGKIYYLKMEWSTLFPKQVNRDIIFDLGPHPIDIMNYLLGNWPNSVSCNAKGYRDGAKEELAYLNLEFDKNIMAHIELSWLQPGKVRELHIIGSEKTATIDCVSQKVKVKDDNDTCHNVEVIANNTIFDEVSHFVNSIRDENNHKNPGPIGASNIAVLQCLKKSMVERKQVNVCVGTPEVTVAPFITC